MFTPSPSEPSSFQNLPKMQFIRAIFSSGTTLGRKKNYFFHAASSNNNALLQSHRGCDFCHKIRASLSSVLISIQQVALLAMELKPKHLKNCEFCPGSQFIVFMLIFRALNWQYHNHSEIFKMIQGLKREYQNHSAEMLIKKYFKKSNTQIQLQWNLLSCLLWVTREAEKNPS